MVAPVSIPRAGNIRQRTGSGNIFESSKKHRGQLQQQIVTVQCRRYLGIVADGFLKNLLSFIEPRLPLFVDPEQVVDRVQPDLFCLCRVHANHHVKHQAVDERVAGNREDS